MPWKPKSAEDIVHKWDKHVAKRFDDFFTVLKKRPVKIPDKYLEENSIENNGKLYRNFLELFLRYDTAKAIADIITGLSEEERTNLTEDVIHPYWAKWDKLLNSIGTIFGQTKDVLDVTSNFHTLKNWCGDFNRGCGIFDEEVAHYEKSFDAFCKAFAVLPRKPKGPATLLAKTQLTDSEGYVYEVSKYARGKLDITKCDLHQRRIHLKGVPRDFRLSASKAWNNVILLLTNEDKRGFTKLGSGWQSHFGTGDYAAFRDYIHPRVTPKAGKKSAGKSGDGFYRIDCAPFK